MPKLRIISLVILAIGILMLAVSLFRTPEDAMRSAWTEKDATQKSQASLEVNQIIHLLEHPGTPDRQKRLEDQLKAAQMKYKQAENRFTSLQARQERIHALLKWTGLALILLGGILYWPTK